MLYWECKRRLTVLRQFRVLASDYFKNIQNAGWQSAGVPPRMNEVSVNARGAMNLLMQDVLLSLNLIGVSASSTYLNPMGGYSMNVHVIENIFDLWQFRMRPTMAFDTLDRAIGAYDQKCKRLFRQTFNPVYWLGLLIAWVFHLPFQLLRAAGFKTTKFEESFLGKLSKLTVGGFGFAYLLADHWSMTRDFIRKCIQVLHRP